MDVPRHDVPYLLRDEGERAVRRTLLDEPHIKDLTAFVKRIRRAWGLGHEVPDFDPLDGGVRARALFLLEAPGPQAVRSTFISQNNPDPSAENMWCLRHLSGLRRRDMLLWNVVPWYVGRAGSIRPVRKEDLEASKPYLDELLTFLARLEIVVLVGKNAETAREQMAARRGLTIFTSPHPADRVFNTRPENRLEAFRVFYNVARLIAAERI